VKLLCGIVAVVAALVAATSAWAWKAPNRQPPRSAELNLLHAPRLLGKWNASFIDPKTKLPRSNIVVQCEGVSGEVHGAYHVLRCTVTLAPWQARARYVALGRYGFIAQNVSVSRA
jgi:hypothetical protein